MESDDRLVVGSQRVENYNDNASFWLSKTGHIVVVLTCIRRCRLGGNSCWVFLGHAEF